MRRLLPHSRTFLLSSPLRPRLRPPLLIPPSSSPSSSPLSIELLHTTPPNLTTPPLPSNNPHRAYYQTHGRALFKTLTLAFLTYQIVYWAWLTLETGEIRHQKEREIRGLEGEVRGLEGKRGEEGM